MLCSTGLPSNPVKTVCPVILLSMITLLASHLKKAAAKMINAFATALFFS
jgi:hypothetical protein